MSVVDVLGHEEPLLSLLHVNAYEMECRVSLPPKITLVASIPCKGFRDAYSGLPALAAPQAAFERDFDHACVNLIKMGRSLRAGLPQSCEFRPTARARPVSTMEQTNTAPAAQVPPPSRGHRVVSTMPASSPPTSDRFQRESPATAALCVAGSVDSPSHRSPRTKEAILADFEDTDSDASQRSLSPSQISPQASTSLPATTPAQESDPDPSAAAKNSVAPLCEIHSEYSPEEDEEDDDIDDFKSLGAFLQPSQLSHQSTEPSLLAAAQQPTAISCSETASGTRSGPVLPRPLPSATSQPIAQRSIKTSASLSASELRRRLQRASMGSSVTGPVGQSMSDTGENSDTYVQSALEDSVIMTMLFTTSAIAEPATIHPQYTSTWIHQSSSIGNHHSPARAASNTLSTLSGHSAATKTTTAVTSIGEISSTSQMHIGSRRGSTSQGVGATVGYNGLRYDDVDNDDIHDDVRRLRVDVTGLRQALAVTATRSAVGAEVGGRRTASLGDVEMSETSTRDTETSTGITTPMTERASSADVPSRATDGRATDGRADDGGVVDALNRLVVVGLTAAQPSGALASSWTGHRDTCLGWQGVLRVAAESAAAALRDARGAGSSHSLGIAAASSAATSVLSSMGVLSL